MKAIKYCPFCGKEAKIFVRDIPPYDSKVYGVSCMACTARVFGYSLPEIAVEMWNKRVNG